MVGGAVVITAAVGIAIIMGLGDPKPATAPDQPATMSAPVATIQTEQGSDKAVSLPAAAKGLEKADEAKLAQQEKAGSEKIAQDKAGSNKAAEDKKAADDKKAANDKKAAEAKKAAAEEPRKDREAKQESDARKVIYRPPAIESLASCQPREEDYPRAARRANAQGMTQLRLSVDTAGKLVSAEIIRRSGQSAEHLLLDKVALEKFSQCSFRPGADSNGNPVAGTLSPEFLWRLD
jgi:TonB family protein